MKKLFLTMTFMLTAMIGFAQSANDIISQMKTEEGVETQVITKMMMQMQLSQIPDENVKNVMKKINSMTMMSVTKASDEAKAKFGDMITKLTDNGYEKAEDIEENGIKAVSYTKKEGETITELVNVVEAQGEKMFILISGKFALEDLEYLNNM